MKPAKAKRLGEQIELALTIDPSAVREACDAIAIAARNGLDLGGGASSTDRYVASLLLVSAALSEVVDS